MRISRHHFLAGAGMVGALVASRSVNAAGMETQASADIALAELIAGNRRFVSGAMQHPNASDERRAKLAAGQSPIAAVLSCSDSRVPPEIVFDQGLGDLFVVRVAGNIASPAEIGSLEYAVEHLHVPLIVVLGHDKCGAVAAALEAVESGGTAPGHVGVIVDAIKPAVLTARKQTGDLLANAIRNNVGLVDRQLRDSQPLLAPAAAASKLKIAAAVYSLTSGAVTYL